MPTGRKEGRIIKTYIRLYRLALFLALCILVYWFAPFRARPAHLPEDAVEYCNELLQDEIREGRFFRLVDEDGRLITVTGRRIKVGDRYLNADNRLYEVVQVEDYVARARFKEEVEFKLKWPAASEAQPVRPVQKEDISYTIGIYHSHNDESYVPSDGTESIYGKGGIHDVGRALADALAGKGIKVIYDEQLHLPHDQGAYRRSRSTALNLTRRKPDAIFDVHRDAAPWEAYAAEVKGQSVTQIQIVIGYSNPIFNINQNFAYDLKGYADRLFPGLIKGIFTSFGGFNQDLTPFNLLIEVGAHTNSKEAAMRGVTFFADVVSYYFYGPRFLENGIAEEQRQRDDFLKDREALPPALYKNAGGITSTVSGTVLGLMLASLAAALGFYFLNNPEALERFRQWLEDLPERARLIVDRGREFVLDFPRWFAERRREYPDNLRFAWRELVREARSLPAATARVLEVIRRKTVRFAASLPERREEFRRNLAYAWGRLQREAVILSEYVRGFFLFLRRRWRI